MKRLYPLFVAALLMGCTADDNFQTPSSDFPQKVRLSISRYDYEDSEFSTRTTLTADATGITFAWDNDEKIGIFPITGNPEEDCQVGKKIGTDVNENGNYAEFDGGAWQLKRGVSYAAYYPYNGSLPSDTHQDQIPVDMTGQVQNGNDSPAHIGAGYDYMYTTPTTCSEGAEYVNFTFHHLASIIQVKLTMPEAKQLSNITFANAENKSLFSVKANMSASEGALKNKEYAASISLGLNNVTCTAGQQLTFYIALLPTTTGSVEVTATASDGEKYIGTLKSKTTLAGKAYRWVTTLSKMTDEFEGKAYVDLGTGDGIYWGRENLNANYYSWGNYETSASYTLNSYLWAENGAVTKYNSSDNLTQLQLAYEESGFVLSDDIARDQKKTPWRMPTKQEFENLVTKCDWTWTTENSVNGYKVSSKSTPSRYIFIPVSGYKEGSETKDATSGYYWSSNVYASGDYLSAYCLKFGQSSKSYNSTASRYFGMKIRPVYQAQ